MEKFIFLFSEMFLVDKINSRQRYATITSCLDSRYNTSSYIGFLNSNRSLKKMQSENFNLYNKEILKDSVLRVNRKCLQGNSISTDFCYTLDAQFVPSE